MVKTALSFFMFLACMANVFAQENAPKVPESLFQAEVNHGFYLAPTVQMTNLQGKSGFMVGGKAAWLLNHKVALGLAGYGLMTQNNIGEIAETNNAFLQIGYGGALVEYIPNPDNMFHLTFPIIIGLGGAAYTDSFSNKQNSGKYSYEVYTTDTFFMVEPGVQAELNLARFMRLGMGVSYRFAHGVALPKTTDKDLSAPSLSLTAKFGRF